MASAKTKTNVKFSATTAIDKARVYAAEANETALKGTETAIDKAVEFGTKWQSVASKAMNGGLKLAANQQEIIFSTLESVKTQVQKARANARELMAA